MAPPKPYYNILTSACLPEFGSLQPGKIILRCIVLHADLLTVGGIHIYILLNFLVRTGLLWACCRVVSECVEKFLKSLSPLDACRRMYGNVVSLINSVLSKLCSGHCIVPRWSERLPMGREAAVHFLLWSQDSPFQVLRLVVNSILPCDYSLHPLRIRM
jgi:hypothetical protein